VSRIPGPERSWVQPFERDIDAGPPPEAAASFESVSGSRPDIRVDVLRPPTLGRDKASPWDVVTRRRRALLGCRAWRRRSRSVVARS